MAFSPTLMGASGRVINVRTTHNQSRTKINLLSARRGNTSLNSTSSKERHSAIVNSDIDYTVYDLVGKKSDHTDLFTHPSDHHNPHYITAQEVWQRIDFMKVSEKTPEEVWKQIDFLEVGPKLAKMDTQEMFRRIDFLEVGPKL